MVRQQNNVSQMKDTPGMRHDQAPADTLKITGLSESPLMFFLNQTTSSLICSRQHGVIHAKVQFCRKAAEQNIVGLSDNEIQKNKGRPCEGDEIKRRQTVPECQKQLGKLH